MHRSADTTDHYRQLGEIIIRVLAAAEQLEPHWLKVWNRIAALWLVYDVEGLFAELTRVDRLLREGRSFTPPAAH